MKTCVLTEWGPKEKDFEDGVGRSEGDGESVTHHAGPESFKQHEVK